MKSRLPQDELAWMPEDHPETTAAVAALEEKKILRFCAERGIILEEDEAVWPAFGLQLYTELTKIEFRR